MHTHRTIRCNRWSSRGGTRLPRRANVCLQRAHQLLKTGGRLGIVLPETYFFSTSYRFLFDWMKGRLKPLIVANVPMEAFQGFCRAKTNFYIFEKIG